MKNTIKHVYMVLRGLKASADANDEWHRKELDKLEKTGVSFEDVRKDVEWIDDNAGCEIGNLHLTADAIAKDLIDSIITVQDKCDLLEKLSYDIKELNAIELKKEVYKN